MVYKLFHGASPFLSLEAAHKYIYEEIIKDTFESLAIDADTTKAQNIIDTISSPSLFSSRRIIFLKRVYKNKEKEILIENILKSMENLGNEDIIIIWEDQKIKSNTKYYKFFSKMNELEEYPLLNKRSFITWLRSILEKEELKIEPSAIKILAESTNYDPERCYNVIKKFKLKDENRIIKENDLEEITINTLENDIWELIDSINVEDKKRSLLILNKLLSQHVDSNYILSMLGRNLRLIFLTKELLNKSVDYGRIASVLKVPPFTVGSLVKSSKGYTQEKMKFIYSKLSNLDHQIKTGKIDGPLGLTLICPYL